MSISFEELLFVVVPSFLSFCFVFSEPRLSLPSSLSPPFRPSSFQKARFCQQSLQKEKESKKKKKLGNGAT
jgi:hypothetical protein